MKLFSFAELWSDFLEKIQGADLPLQISFGESAFFGLGMCGTTSIPYMSIVNLTFLFFRVFRFETDCAGNRTASQCESLALLSLPICLMGS